MVVVLILMLFMKNVKETVKFDELFDELISILQKIIDSEEIDSIKIINTLKTIVTTLGRHDKASYLSLFTTWDNFNRLAKNTLVEYLESIHGIGPFVKALKKTMEETEGGMIGLQQELKDKIQTKYNEDLYSLDAHKAKKN